MKAEQGNRGKGMKDIPGLPSVRADRAAQAKSPTTGRGRGDAPPAAALYRA